MPRAHAMRYDYLGSTGLKVSKLSFGSWVTFGKQLDIDAAADMMQAAYDHGCNFFDNAESYGAGRSEELMGQALQKVGWSRDAVVVATKLFWGGSEPNQRGLSRKHIVEGIQASLHRLRLDHVDILFAHRPDRHTPMEETVRAFNHVIDRGWALYWGTSEWSAAQLQEAWAVADRLGLIGPATEQPQYHLFHRERVEVEYANLVATRGLGMTTWSPLASGLLTGKYNDGIPEGSRFALPRYAELKRQAFGDAPQQRIAKLRALSDVASDLSITTGQLAIAWCAQHPHVSTIITGASRLEQLHQNFGALAALDKLTPEVLEHIEAIVENCPEPERDFRDG